MYIYLLMHTNDVFLGIIKGDFKNDYFKIAFG